MMPDKWSGCDNANVNYLLRTELATDLIEWFMHKIIHLKKNLYYKYFVVVLILHIFYYVFPFTSSALSPVIYV